MLVDTMHDASLADLRPAAYSFVMCVVARNVNHPARFDFIVNILVLGGLNLNRSKITFKCWNPFIITQKH